MAVVEWRTFQKFSLLCDGDHSSLPPINSFLYTSKLDIVAMDACSVLYMCVSHVMDMEWRCHVIGKWEVTCLQRVVHVLDVLGDVL